MSKRQITYMELLQMVNDKIVAEYGSLSKFTNSAEYKKCGIGETASKKHMLYTLLSLPKDGGDKKVKSIPMMAKLCKHLLWKRVESVTRVKRTTTITIEDIPKGERQVS